MCGAPRALRRTSEATSQPFPDHHLSISEWRAKRPYYFCNCIRWQNKKTPRLAHGAGGASVSLPVEMTVTLYGVRPRISTPAPVLSMAVCCFEPCESLSLRRVDGYKPSSTPRRRAIPLAPGRSSSACRIPLNPARVSAVMNPWSTRKGCPHPAVGSLLGPTKTKSRRR